MRACSQGLGAVLAVSAAVAALYRALHRTQGCAGPCEVDWLTAQCVLVRSLLWLVHVRPTVVIDHVLTAGACRDVVVFQVWGVLCSMLLLCSKKPEQLWRHILWYRAGVKRGVGCLCAAFAAGVHGVRVRTAVRVVVADVCGWQPEQAPACRHPSHASGCHGALCAVMLQVVCDDDVPLTGATIQQWCCTLSLLLCKACFVYIAEGVSCR